MNEKPSIIAERTDDLPVWLAPMEHTAWAVLLDTHVPVHGNRQGLGFGLMATICGSVRLTF